MGDAGPVCQGDMIAVAGGTELLFVNPHSTSGALHHTLTCSAAFQLPYSSAVSLSPRQPAQT